MKRNELYDKAIEIYGYEQQETMVLEEMFELGKVITKGRRSEINKGDLVDEIADLEIVIEQMKQYHDIGDKVSARKRFKKKRLLKRLNHKENEDLEVF